MNEDLLVQLVADHYRAVDPKISNKQLVEKFNWAKDNIEQFSNEIYKREKGQPIDKRNLDLIAEKLGTKVDYSKVPGMSYVGNVNSKVIKAKNEYDRLSDESPLPEQYTQEEFNAAVEKEKSSMLINKVPFGLGYAFSDKTPADVDKEAKKAVADKHTKLINAKKEYEALRPTIETDKVISIEDIYRDAKRDVRAKDIADNAKNEVLPAMHIGAKVNSLLFNDKKNDLSEISVNMKKKADAYLNVLQQNITDSFIKIKDENERHLAAEMLTGKIDNYDPNGQYSAELESYVDQLTKLTSQQKEFAKIYNAPKTGKSYDDVVRDRYVAEAKKADQGKGNSLVGAWAGTVKEGWKSLTRIIGDNLTFDDGEKVLNELDKGGQFTDKQIQVLNNYNLQQSINQIEKISSTARKSDWGSPLLINTAVVDGYTLVVDDKKQFQYMTGPDGKTVHSPNEKQMAAIQKFNQNPSAYQVVHGWTTTPFKAATNLVGETIAQMVPMIAASAIATAAAPGTGGASIGALVGTATMFAQQYGNYYEEELQRSGDAGKAGQYAAIMAGVESVAEVLGGAVEMKLAKSLAGKSGKNVIMDAARRTADEAAAAKNVAGFSFLKAFTGNLSKDIGQEYAEEFGTLFAQSGVNAMFGNNSDITANDLISTVVATPFATAALSAIPSYQAAKDSYKETLMAAAANPTAFVDNMALMVESGKVSQEEAKTKVSMVNKLADRNKEYNDFVRDNKISLTKQEGDKLESLIFDEVFSMAKKPKDNSEKINAILNSAKQRSFEERAEEPAPERVDITQPDVIDAEFEQILDSDQPSTETSLPSRDGTNSLNTKKHGKAIDSDGTWYWDATGNASTDIRGKNTIHLNSTDSWSSLNNLYDLFEKNGISALLDSADTDNRHAGKIEIHFETVDDAKKAHVLMIQAGLVGENALGDLVGHELEGNMVFTQGNFMNRDIAKHIVENAVKNEDGSFTAPDMITGEDFTFPAEKMAAYEQIYRGSKNAWEAEPGAIVGGQQDPEQPAADVQPGTFTAPTNNTSNTITAVPGNRGTENTRSGVNTVLDFLVNGPRQVVYEGKLATLSMDEGGKVELNQTGLVKELGNIVEVGDTSISQFGISPMPTAGITDQNTIRIGDNLYVNRYSDPMAAIDFEGDSPVVDLERIVTTGGYQNRKTTVRYEKVVLTGAEAEIAASLITNAALASNPVLAQEMNDFVRDMPEYEKIDQEAKGYDADPEEVFDVEVKQSVVDYLMQNFEGMPETVYAMAELFSLIAERMSRTFPDQYPTAVDYIKQKMVGFGEPNLTFEILNQFLDGAIETTNNDNVRAELQDIKSFLDANRSAFIVQSEPTTAEPVSTERQPGQPTAEPTTNAEVVPEAVPGGNELQVLGKDKEENKNVITREIVTEKLSIDHPFYKKVEEALVKLGLIEKYNPETKTGDVVGGYVQKTSDGEFSAGKMIFSKDGSISYLDGDVKVSFDNNGNVISENIKEANLKSIKLGIESRKETISNFEKKRDSDGFKYKEVTETDLLGNKKKVKKLKTPQELKESTDKLNEYIQNIKSEILELENKYVLLGGNELQVLGEDKKADIERRRQEELKTIPVGSATMMKYVADGNNRELIEEEKNTAEELIQAFIENGEKDADKVIRYLTSQGFVRSPYTGIEDQRAYIKARLEGTITTPVNGKVVDDINAKYDAELSLLEGSSAANPTAITEVVPEAVPGGNELQVLDENQTGTVVKNDQIIDQEVKPIGQLGTGANIYFEVPQRYRVNDAIKDGGYYLLMTYSGEDTPFYTENYKDKNEAVFIAKSISNELPDGLIRDYHDVDAIVSNLRKEYSDLKSKELGSDEIIDSSNSIPFESILTVRDLFNYSIDKAGDLGLLFGAVVDGLKDGDILKIGDKKYSVSKSKNPSLKSYETKDKNGNFVKGSYRQTTVKFTNLKDNTSASGKTWSDWIVGDQKYIPIMFGNKNWDKISRDVEGVLSIDLINENNPLHDFSDVYKLVQSQISNVARNKQVDLFGEQKLLTFDQNVQAKVDELNKGKEKGDKYVVKSVEDFVKNSAPFTFLSGLKLVTIVNPKTKNQLYQVFDKNGKVPPGVRPNFIFSPKVIYDELISYLKNDIKRFFDNWNIPEPTFMKDVFDNPGSKSLSDLLDPVHSSEFLGAQIFEINEKIKKSGGIEKAPKRLIEKSNEFGYYLVNYQDLLLSELTNSLFDLAVKLGYLTANDSDKFNSFTEEYFKYFIDTDYMWGVPIDISIRDYAKPIFDEYFGKPAGGVGQVMESDGGQVSIQEGQAGASEEVQSGASPDSGGRTETATPILKVPESIIDDGIDNAGLPNELRTDLITTGDPNFDSILNDFKAAFDEWAGNAPGDEPVMKSKDDTKLLSMGAKLMDMYVAQGKTKFEEILADLSQKMGNQSPEFLTAIKKVYVSSKISNPALDSSFDFVANYSPSVMKKEMAADKPISKPVSKEKTTQKPTKKPPVTGGDLFTSLQNYDNEQRASNPRTSSSKPGGDLFSKPNDEQGGAGVLPSEEIPGVQGNDGIADQSRLQQSGGQRNSPSRSIKPVINRFVPSLSTQGSFNQLTRFRGNLDAINELLNILQSEEPVASDQQKEILSKYVGFGGIKGIIMNEGSKMSEVDQKMRPMVEELIALSEKFDQLGFGKNTFDQIKSSILNAHFTSEEVIRSVYAGLSQLGFESGSIIEPSAGIGNFIGHMPMDIRQSSSITSVELEPITGYINKLIYPETTVQITGFEESGPLLNYYDLAVSNIPFGSYTVYDKSFNAEQKALGKLRIHNYFFVKALDKVREGGLVAFVTSAGFMDSPGNEAVRNYVGKHADFLGAVRLPSSAFKKNANTEVVTDIIFLRKNSGAKIGYEIGNLTSISAPSEKTGESNDVTVNEYFVQNPRSVIGEFRSQGGLYSGDEDSINVVGEISEGDIVERLSELLPSNIYDKSHKKPAIINTSFLPNTIYLDEQGIPVYNNRLIEVKQLPKTIKPAQALSFIRLRDSLRVLYDAEYSNVSSDEDLSRLRKKLNVDYDSYVNTYGLLTNQKSKPLVSNDDSGYYMLTLADKEGKKSDIFFKKVISPVEIRENIDDINEAVIYSLQMFGDINLPFIADAMNLSTDHVLDISKGIIFKQPDGSFVDRSKYLSGNVKKKLLEAREALKTDNSYQINVDELEKVIPDDIPVYSIELNIGSRWVPNDVYSTFLNEIFDVQGVKIKYSGTIDQIKISGPISEFSSNKYGTSRINGYEIFEKIFYGKAILIYDKMPDHTSVLNRPETEKANEKAELLKEAFQDWIWKDEDRRISLGRIYNDTYNTSVARNYDGSFLNFPGLTNISPRAHQKDAVYRILTNKGGIIDHIVGAGKTLVAIMAAMEMRRMGVAKKPVFIALKSTLMQIYNEAKEYYPMAKILVSKSTDFAKEKRKLLLASIANNDYDLIIMSHENYGKIPQSVEILKEQIEEELDIIEQEIRSLGKDSLSKEAEKGLIARKKNLDSNLKKLSNMSKDDELMTFDKLGIDHLFVDESQQFKNLEYATKTTRVAGLGKPDGSKRSFNLLVGLRTLQKRFGGDKGATFLSGTPISNSMVEMYLLLKYLRPNKMEEMGLKTFDAWANAFARIDTKLEFNIASEVKPKTRVRTFINVPELSMLYREIADVRNEYNLKLPRPNFKNGDMQLVSVPMDEVQETWKQNIIDFVKENNPNPSLIGRTYLSEADLKAKMLIATDIGSKMAVDMRLIDPSLPFNPNGKIAAVANNVFDYYQKTTEHKGVQLIFSDIGTPKSGNKMRDFKSFLEDYFNIQQDDIEAIFGEPDESGEIKRYPTMQKVKENLFEVLEWSDGEIDDAFNLFNNDTAKFSVYAETKKLLVEKGIPENEIQFIHDYNSDIAKSKLFDKVRNGDVRVLLGSTQKLGTGVSVQKRIVAMHHIDVLWRPADFEQRNGRGIRQGNIVALEHYNNEVGVYVYATEGSLDAYKFQLQSTKGRFINQLKSGNVTDRVVNDEDGDDIMARYVAEISGNPDLYLKEKLQVQVDKMKRARNNYYGEINDAKNKVDAYDRNIINAKNEIEILKKDSEIIKQNAKVLDPEKDKGITLPLNVNVSGKTFKNYKELGTAIIVELELAKKTPVNHVETIGTVNGISLKIKNKYDIFFQEVIPFLYLESIVTQQTYQVYRSSDPSQQGLYVNKALDKVSSDILELEDKISRTEKLKIQAESIANSPEWPKEVEYTKAKLELEEVENRLNSLSENKPIESSLDENGEPVVKSIIGPKSLLFTDTKYKEHIRAMEMDVQGVHPAKIKIFTGWEKGADGKWRYEISDPIISDPETMFSMLAPSFVDGTPVETMVGDIFADYEIFNYYPQLKTVKVEFGPGKPGSVMSYDPKNRTIKVNAAAYFMDYLSKKPDNINKGLLHEITHYVQVAEGLNLGASPDFFKNVPASKQDALNKLEELKNRNGVFSLEQFYDDSNTEKLINMLLALPEWISDNHQRYLAVAGEIEAKSVEDRYGFSTLKRRATLLNNQKNSIVLSKGVDEMSMASQQNAILEEAKTRIIKTLLMDTDADTAVSGLFKVFEADLLDEEKQVLIDNYNRTFADQVASYNLDVSNYASSLWGNFVNNPDSVTSSPLKKLLEKFSQWMVDLYDSFTNSKGQTVKIEISPEVRAVFENIITNGNTKRFQKTDKANADGNSQRIFARKAKFRSRQAEDGSENAGDSRPEYAQRDAESNEIKFSGGAIPGQGGSTQRGSGAKNSPRPDRFKSASGTWYRWDAGAGRWRTSIVDASGNFSDRNILSDKRNAEVEAEFIKSRVTIDNVASNEDVIFNGTKNKASNLSGAMFISPRNIATLNLPARLYSLLNTVNLADVKVRIYDNGGDYKAAVEANRNNAVSRQRSLSPDEMTSIGEINVNKIANVKGIVKNTILKYNYIDVVGFDIQEQSDIAEIHKLVNNPAVPKTKLVFFDGNGAPESMHMVGIGSMNHNEHVSSILDANPGKNFAIIYETNGVGNESQYVETASSLFKTRPEYLGRVHVNGVNEVKNSAGIDYASVKAMDSNDFVAYMDGSKIVDFQYTNNPDKNRQYIQSTTDGRDYITDGNFTGGMEENIQAAQNVIFRDKATAAFAGGIVHINGAGFDIYDVELAVLRAIANLDPDKFTSELIENLRKSDYISRKYAFPDVFDETEITEGPGAITQEDASKVTPPSPELVAKYQNAKKYYGKDKMVILPDGTRVRGRYVLVDAYDMSTSHDETTFTDTPGFPTDNGKNSNDRNYKDDVSAQGAVITAGNHFDERAIDAPPVLSSEGIVLSGNNRTMSARLGAAKNTNKKYMAALPEVLTEKSISGDLSGMRAPMLAIELYDQVPYTTGVFARFNKEEKKSKTTEDTMQSIKSFVNDALAGEIGQRIAEFDNISQFFDRDATWVISKLIQNGIIDKFRVTEFADIARDNTYSLKDSGKQLVRNILLSSILDTDLIERVREEGLKEVFNKVSSASKLFLENKTTQAEYNMIQDLNDGIRLFIEYKRNKSMNTIANVVKATDIFDATFSQDYTTEAILMAMYLEGPETQLKEFVGAVNTAIQGNMANSLFSDIQEQLTKTDIYGRYIDMKLEKLNGIIAGKYPKDVKDKAATDAALLNDIKKIGFGQTYKAAVVGGVLKSKTGNNNLKTLSRLYSDVVSGKDVDLANAFNAAVKRSLDAFGYGAVTNYAVKAGIKDLYGVFLGKKIDMSVLSDGVLQNIGNMAKSGMIALTPIELYKQFPEKFAAYGITPGDIATAMDLPLQDVVTRSMSSDEIAELGLPDQVENPYDFYRGLGMADNAADFARNIYDLLPDDYNKTATALMIIADMNDYHDRFEIVHYAPSAQELPEDAAVNFTNEVYSSKSGINYSILSGEVNFFVDEIILSAVNSNYPLPLIYEQYAYKSGFYTYEPGSMVIDEDGGIHQVVGPHYTDVVTSSNEIVSPVSKTDPIQGIATKVATATGVPVVLLPGDKFASEYKKYGANALLFTDTVNRRIVANADAITSKELFHEGAHVAVINYFLDNRDALPAFHRAIAAVLQNGTIEEKALAQRVSDWADQYTHGDAIDAKLPLDVLRAHEFFAELIALLAENSAQITKPTEAGIVQAIKNLLSRIFGIDFDIELNDLNDVIDFINGVAQNLTIGKPESAVFQSKSAKTITTDSVMKAKDNNIFGNNGTQVKIYTYDNRGVNLYLEGKVMSQGRDDNGDRTVQIMNSAGEIENYLYDQFHSLTRNGEKFIVISGYAQDINDKYHTPSQLRKLDKIVGALFKDPTLDVHSIYTTYKKDFAKNGLTMGDVRAAVENSRSEDRGEQVKEFMNDPQVSDYVKRRLLFLGKNVIGDILANANAFKKSGITNEEIQIYIQNLLASANTPDELYAIFDQLKAQKIDFVNDGFFSKVYAMAIIEVARRVRAAEDLTFGFIPSRLAEIIMEEQLVASAGAGFMQGVQKNTSDDIYSTKELNKVWTHLNSLNTEELKNFNQDGRSLYDIINEMAEEVKFSDDEVDEMTNDESVWDILRRMFDENKLDTEFLKNLYDEYFGTTADEPVMKSVISNDVHKEIIQKLFKKFGDDKFAIMANYRAIIEMRYPGIDFDQYMSDNPFVTQLLAKEYARMSINSFKKTFSSNLDPSIAAVLSRAYKKNISEDDADMAKDPVSKLEELFSKKDVTISALQEMLAEVDDKLSFSTNPDTLLNYRNSLYQTIESLKTESGQFTGATENQFLNAITFGINKLDKGQLESMGYAIPTDAKPSDYASIIMKHLVRQSAGQLNVSVNGMARLFVTKMGLTEPQATELATAINEVYLKKIMETKKALVEQKLKTVIKDDKKRVSLMDRMIDTLLLGDISDARFAEAFADKFNLKYFDTDDLGYINKLLDIWNDPMASPRDRQNAYRLIKSKIAESTESRASTILGMIKSLSFIALLSGFNTVIRSFVSSFASNIAMDVTMTAQLARRGHYGTYKEYKNKNRDLFGFNPLEYAYSLVQGKPKKEILHSAGVAAAIDAMLYGVGNISTSDTPDESFSKFDVILNEYTSKLASVFGRESKISGVVDKKSPRERIAGAIIAIILGGPILMVRTLGAMDVMMNTSSYEKAAFIEAIDAAHAEVGNTKSDEFFRVLHEKMGKSDLPSGFSTAGMSALDIATIKKRRALESRDQKTRDLATQRVLTGMVINSNVGGLFTGLTSGLLTFAKNNANSAKDPYSKVLWQAIDTFMIVPFFPIVKTVMNTVYLGYQYSPLSVPVNSLIKAASGIDKIQYDVSSGRLLLNGLTLSEIKGSTKNSLFSVLFDKNSAGRKRLADNAGTKAEFEAMVINSITGTAIGLMTLLYFFDLEEDKDGMYLVKDNEAWENFKVFAAGVLFDPEYDEKTKKREYSGQPFIDNKRVNGDEFKENNAFIYGWHFNWTDMPMAPTLGTIGILGDKMKYQRISFADAAAYSTLGSMQYHFGEGFAIGLNQLSTIFTAIGAKGTKNEKAATNELAKMIGKNIASRMVPNLYRQSYQAKRGLFKEPSIKITGESFYDVMQSAYTRDIPFFDKVASTDITGNPYEQNFDTYFIPDAFEQHVSDLVAKQDQNAASKIINDKDVDKSVLYKTRGQALRTDKKYKIPEGAKDQLHQKWGELYRDLVENNRSELIGMNKDERQAFLEEMARSVKDFVEYQQLKDSIKVELTAEELKELEKKSTSKKGKSSKVKDEFDLLLEQQNKK